MYPDSSQNTDILSYNSIIVLPVRAILEELILCIALAAGAISLSILQPLLGVYWQNTCNSTVSIFSSTLPVELDLGKILLS